ncbi:MAG TPA: acyl--CoA ligase [Ktedonobacteraceae bacterium]|nr:acyl--CoA ligase [Ktedonobacteraceae bacterium]
MPSSTTTSALFRAPLLIPDVPYDHLLRQTAEQYPERHAILFHEQVLTYREVVSLVNSLANGLRGSGLGKGDTMCVFTPNCPEYTLLFEAAATIGAIFSPINPFYKERELAYQLSDAEARAIVVHENLLPLLNQVLQQGRFPQLRQILVIGEERSDLLPEAHSLARLIWQSSPQRPEPASISGDDILALPYSSGTTGLPKGVMLSHRNLVANHTQFRAATRLTQTDTALIFLPLYHSYGILLTGSFLAAGGTQILMERFELQQVLDLCERHGVTWLFAVPPVFLALHAAPAEVLREKMKTIKYIMSAAAPLAPAIGQAIEEKLGVKVVQGYGLTESSPDTHLSPLEEMGGLPGNVGLPVHNTEQKIVDIETGERELAVGEKGEVLLRGPQIMPGYWKASEENARALRNGWLYTGDIGYLDEQGFLYIVDRKKEMIKYKGFSIAPAELEAVLLTHEAIQDAAVIGVANEEAGELPKGYVVVKAGRQVSEEELLGFVNQQVAGYKKLHAIAFLDALPRVPSGKLLRRVLKERENQ